MSTEKNATPKALIDAAPNEPHDRVEGNTGEVLRLEATWKTVNDGCDVLATMDGKAIGYVNRTIGHDGRERFTVGVGDMKRDVPTRDEGRGLVVQTMRRAAHKVGLMLTLVNEQRHG